MEQRQREDLAIERADKYAPMPEGGSLMAGVTGALTAWLGDAVLSRFYDWQVLDHPLIATLLIVAGFIVGVFVHKRLRRTSRKARHAELAQIHLDEDRKLGD
jgi:hypothetical protein